MRPPSSTREAPTKNGRVSSRLVSSHRAASRIPGEIGKSPKETWLFIPLSPFSFFRLEENDSFVRPGNNAHTNYRRMNNIVASNERIGTTERCFDKGTSSRCRQSRITVGRKNLREGDLKNFLAIQFCM